MGSQLRCHRLAVLLALPLLALASCGGGDSDGAGQQGGPAQAKAPEAPALKVVRPDARSSTTSARVEVEGTVTEGATVEVDGKPAKIDGPANEESRSRWSAKVALKRGKNVIEVAAALEGKTTRAEVVVTRKAKESDGDGSGSGEGSADATPPSGNQGGSTGEGPSGGNQGGSGGSQGGAQGDQGGGVGGPDEGPQGGQGGSGGSGGNQGGGGGSGGGGGQGGPPGADGDGAQGGPQAAPPPPPPRIP